MHLVAVTSSRDKSIGYGDSAYSITQYSNDDMYIIAQNDSNNTYNPIVECFDWTVDANNDVYICQIAYDAATEADALNTVAADATDPATGGCGGFTWSLVTPEALEIIYTWDDGFGGSYDITSDSI